MNKSQLDIVIPVYNEGEKITKLIKLIEKKLTIKFKIFICYDSEEDTTLKFIKKNKKKIIFVKNPGRGPNTAIIHGISKTNANIVVVYMADDFKNIDLINLMYQEITSGYDLIIPSRFIKDGKFIGEKFFKKSVATIGYLILFYLVGIPFRDCTNAFKMFNRKIIKKIKLESKFGFTYALEMTIKAYFMNFNIKELPYVWIYNDYRKSNFKIFKWIPYYLYWVIYGFKKKILNLIN